MNEKIDEKEFKLIEQYWNELEKGNTNMGYDQWKLTSEVLNNDD